MAAVGHPKNVALGAAQANAIARSALLTSVGIGCIASFETFYRMTRRRVFSVVLRINGNRNESEEVLQEVYLKVWREACRFDIAKGCAMQWLVAMARNQAIDSLRRRQVRPQSDVCGVCDAEECDGNDLPSGLAGPLDLLEDQRRAEALHIGLAGLPQWQRDSLRLAYFEDQSHAEMAHSLQRPIGTVKSWVRRALVTLRSSLQANA